MARHGSDVEMIAAAEPLDAMERSRLERVEGIVFDIQRYSLHDGPGLRTNVFLKGCPLRCGWCSNPESQGLQPELALYARNCIACGQFREACPTRWEATNGWSKELVDEYAERAKLCPTGAIRWIGERRTAGDVMAEVRRDIPFYEDGGGMTLTGGEPTMQPEMALALLRLAKAELISTALETCGQTRWQVLAQLLPYLDHILFDLKHMDSETHRRHTGLGNELILSNLRRLAALGAPVTVRVPLVPGFNATEACVRAIATFVAGLGDAVRGLDVLPYHTLGRSKYKALGREYSWAKYDRLSDQAAKALAAVAAESGLPVTIGG